LFLNSANSSRKSIPLCARGRGSNIKLLKLSLNILLCPFLRYGD